MGGSNRAFKTILLIIITVAFVLALAASYITMVDVELGRRMGILVNYNTTLMWSDRDPNQNVSLIRPAPWTFAVWGPIFIHQALLIGYFWSTLCRRITPDGPYLCSDPDLAPYGVLVWHTLSSVCGVAWSLLADRVDFENHLRIPQSAVLFAFAICLYLCLISSYWNLYMEKKKLIIHNRRCEFWLVVAFVQNGVSLYATWCTIASFLNLNTALVYNAGVDPFISSTACLAAVMAIVIVYALADLTVLDAVTRYVFTPHLVVAWACAGSLARNFVAWSPTTIMTVVLLCLVVLAFIVKLIVICGCRKTKPILAGGSYQFQDKQPI